MQQEMQSPKLPKKFHQFKGKPLDTAHSFLMSYIHPAPVLLLQTCLETLFFPNLK